VLSKFALRVSRCVFYVKGSSWALEPTAGDLCMGGGGHGEDEFSRMLDPTPAESHVRTVLCHPSPADQKLVSCDLPTKTPPPT